MKYIPFIVGLAVIPLVYFASLLNGTPEALGVFSNPFLSIQLSTSTATNGYVLSTDGTNNTWVAQTGGGGGGSSLHTDATTYIYPTGGKYHSAPYYVATSTATASTFPLASTTALTTTRGYVTQLANLTGNGFVKTGSGNGTLSIDTTTYESGLTASNGITRTTNDFAPTSGYNIPLTASTTNWNGFYDVPSTRITDGTGLTWSSNTLNVDASQSISTLSNLTSNGFVKTSGGTGALSIDTSTYLTTVDISANTNLTGGLGLTLTGDDMACDTASGSVFGCLSSADWNTFNGKESVLTFSNGLTRTANNIAPTSGYNIPLTASTTNWESFYVTPSNRITAGTNLSWAGNTLNSLSFVSTSTNGTAGSLAYFTGGSTIAPVATTTLTGTAPISLSNAISVIGNTPSAISCAVASGSLAGCLSTTDWTSFNGKVSSTSIDTSAELATLLTNETGTAGSLVFSGAPTFTGTTTFADFTASRSTTTNAVFTNATATTLSVTTTFNFLGTVITNIATWFSTTLNAVSSFVGAVSSTWDFGGVASLEIPNGASPTVDATGEIALNTTTNSLSVATSTTALEIPLYPPVRFSLASSTWTGTTTKIAYVTEPNFDELITSGICFANGTGSIIVGNGTASSSATALTSGTTTVNVNKRFNKNGTRIIYAIGTPTTLSTVQCTFTRVFLR